MSNKKIVGIRTNKVSDNEFELIVSFDNNRHHAVSFFNSDDRDMFAERIEQFAHQIIQDKHLNS